VSPAGVASARQPAVALRHRVSAEQLSAQQAADLQQAFSAVYGIDDDRGYQHHAGIHGLPLPISCQHATPYFLPWHRAYLYFFELALRDQQPGASLPWWDWTSPDSHARGIPQVYSQRGSPLASAAINAQARGQGSRGGLKQGPRTTRKPGDPRSLPTAQQVADVLALGDFVDFSMHLEDIHNALHSWVGGTMGLIPFSAYDPLFWAHHAMIDRIWRLWQVAHPGASPPAAMLGQALAPFPMTVAQTLDVAALGYDYAMVATTISIGTA
jgi:tyrosinase